MQQFPQTNMTTYHAQPPPYSNNIPVQTSYMQPATTQQWAPPKYEPPTNQPTQQNQYETLNAQQETHYQTLP